MIETCSLRKGDNPLMCHIGESPERRFKVFYRLTAQSIMSSNLLGIKTRQWGLRVSTSEPIHSAVRRNVSLRECVRQEGGATTFEQKSSKSR